MTDAERHAVNQWAFDSKDGETSPRFFLGPDTIKQVMLYSYFLDASLRMENGLVDASKEDEIRKVIHLVLSEGAVGKAVMEKKHLTVGNAYQKPMEDNIWRFWKKGVMDDNSVGDEEISKIRTLMVGLESLPRILSFITSGPSRFVKFTFSEDFSSVNENWRSIKEEIEGMSASDSQYEIRISNDEDGNGMDGLLLELWVKKGSTADEILQRFNQNNLGTALLTLGMLSEREKGRGSTLQSSLELDWEWELQGKELCYRSEGTGEWASSLSYSSSQTSPSTRIQPEPAPTPSGQAATNPATAPGTVVRWEWSEERVEGASEEWRRGFVVTKTPVYVNLKDRTTTFEDPRQSSAMNGMEGVEKELSAPKAGSEAESSATRGEGIDSLSTKPQPQLQDTVKESSPTNNAYIPITQPQPGETSHDAHDPNPPSQELDLQSAKGKANDKISHPETPSISLSELQVLANSETSARNVPSPQKGMVALQPSIQENSGTTSTSKAFPTNQKVSDMQDSQSQPRNTPTSSHSNHVNEARVESETSSKSDRPNSKQPNANLPLNQSSTGQVVGNGSNADRTKARSSHSEVKTKKRKGEGDEGSGGSNKKSRGAGGNDSDDDNDDDSDDDSEDQESVSKSKAVTESQQRRDEDVWAADPNNNTLPPTSQVGSSYYRPR